MYNIALPYTRPPGMQIMAILPTGVDRPGPVRGGGKRGRGGARGGGGGKQKSMLLS